MIRILVNIIGNVFPTINKQDPEPSDVAFALFHGLPLGILECAVARCFRWKG